MRAALVPYCSACAASIEQGLPAVQPPLGHRCVASDTACAVGDDWAGGMQGQHYPSQGKALEALKAAIAAAKAAPASTWEGEPLYPSCLAAALPPAASPSSAAAASASSSSRSSKRRAGAAPPPAAAADPFADAAAGGIAQRLPHLCQFPAGAPAGALIAHLDAAGAPRSYGMHWPCGTGTKVDAALAEIERVRQKGEKVIIFSDCRPVLEVRARTRPRVRS